MIEKSKLTEQTEKYIIQYSAVAEKFNKNSIADNNSYLLVLTPLPNPNLDSNNSFFYSYVKYLNDLKPNLEFAKMVDGTYLADFFFLNNEKPLNYLIWFAKIRLVLTKALNNNKIDLESLPFFQDWHKDTHEIFEKYEIIIQDGKIFVEE